MKSITHRELIIKENALYQRQTVDIEIQQVDKLLEELYSQKYTGINWIPFKFGPEQLLANPDGLMMSAQFGYIPNKNSYSMVVELEHYPINGAFLAKVIDKDVVSEGLRGNPISAADLVENYEIGLGFNWIKEFISSIEREEMTLDDVPQEGYTRCFFKTSELLGSEEAKADYVKSSAGYGKTIKLDDNKLRYKNPDYRMFLMLNVSGASTYNNYQARLFCVRHSFKEKSRFNLVIPEVPNVHTDGNICLGDDLYDKMNNISGTKENATKALMTIYKDFRKTFNNNDLEYYPGYMYNIFDENGYLIPLPYTVSTKQECSEQDFYLKPANNSQIVEYVEKEF